MGSPADYATRYDQLEVELENRTVTVHIRRYHCGAANAKKDILWTKLKHHFVQHQKKDPGFSLRLRVDGGSYEMSTFHGMETWIARPFTGKGSPEHCQVVLQLAVLLGETTAEKMQHYCDANLGLDCNGFVGNYLYYEDGAHDWMDQPQEGEGGPNDSMTQFERRGTVVKNTEDMKPSNTYICLETSGGKVIPGGKSGVGHIVITEPGRFMPQSYVFNSFGGMDLNLAKKGAYGHHAFMAVESTANLGLTQSWYAFPKGKSANGVFKIFRGCKAQWLHFKVVDLGL